MALAHNLRIDHPAVGEGRGACADSDERSPATSKPLEIALLFGKRMPDDAELRLAAAICQEPRLRLRTLLCLSNSSGSEDVGGRLPGMVVSLEASLLRRRNGAASKPDENVLGSIGLMALPPRPAGAAGLQPLLTGLDLILDLGGRNEMPTELIGASRFGVWSLHYSDAERLVSPTPAFWEVRLGHGVTGASLLMLGARPSDARIIAVARYPTRTTWRGNLDALRLRAIELVVRELVRLDRDRCLPATVTGETAANLPAPGLRDFAHYAMRPAGAICRQARVAVAARLGMPTNRWSLFVGRGRYDSVPWTDCIETRAPSGQYWADPFLFRLPGSTRLHVFFEAFDMATGRGNISVGYIADGRIVEPRPAIAVDYHLSYPFVFSHAGQIWMIPESHQMQRLELWHCVNFPTQWKLEKTVLEGESVADSTLACWADQWWLFTNRAVAGTVDHNCALSVYRVDSPLMNVIEPHRGNPVVLDATRARNGGRIHLRDGFLMRPAQDNSHHYGYGLSVQRIKTLSLDDYAEEKTWAVRPGFLPGISACHHLDTDGDTFVFDVRRDVG